MTDRDSTTRTRARTLGAEDYSTSMAVHRRAIVPTQRGTTVCQAVHEGWTQTEREAAYAGSRLKPTSASGRPHLTSQPSSRTGENPPYGMIGGIKETSASFEARSAPCSYPTERLGVKVPGPTRRRTRGSNFCFGRRARSGGTTATRVCQKALREAAPSFRARLAQTG